MTYGEKWSGLGMFSLAKRNVVFRRLIRVILLLSATSWEHIEKKEPYSSQMHSNRTRGNRQVGKCEILSRCKEKLFDHKDGQILEQVAKRSCRISIL